jgi:hypothetical protein
MKSTPAESRYVLQSLLSQLSQGRIRKNQVQAVLSRAKEIADLRERLANLEGMGGGGSRRGGRRAGAPSRPKRKRRVAISPKVRALRRLQGKYMGYVRRLKPAEKARVRAVREKEGMQAAIRLAASLATKTS